MTWAAAIAVVISGAAIAINIATVRKQRDILARIDRLYPRAER